MRSQTMIMICEI